MVTIRQMRPSDATTWSALRAALWPEDAEPEHREEIERYLRGDFPRGPWVALVAEDATARTLGFAEVSLRPFAEGCRSSRVGYLEGWYVVPEARSQSENHVSAAAHRALGFADVGLVRCFRKDL